MGTSKKRVKAVTFDLWETLLFERNGANSKRMSTRCMNLQQAFEKFGMKVSLEQVEMALSELISVLVKVWETNKDVTHLEQIRLVIEHVLERPAVMEEQWVHNLSKAYVSPIFEVPPYLNPDASEVLEYLKSQNKLIGLICNTGLTPGTALRKFLAKEDVAKYFDQMVFSDETGIRKPDAEIFQLVTRRLGIKPSEAVHVGDNLRCDIWGAQNAGFKAICLSSEEGHDKIAESDPSSLVSVSRRLGDPAVANIVPYKTIPSLKMALRALEELEA